MAYSKALCTCCGGTVPLTASPPSARSDALTQDLGASVCRGAHVDGFMTNDGLPAVDQKSAFTRDRAGLDLASPVAFVPQRGNISRYSKKFLIDRLRRPTWVWARPAAPRDFSPLRHVVPSLVLTRHIGAKVQCDRVSLHSHMPMLHDAEHRADQAERAFRDGHVIQVELSNPPGGNTPACTMPS